MYVNINKNLTIIDSFTITIKGLVKGIICLCLIFMQHSKMYNYIRTYNYEYIALSAPLFKMLVIKHAVAHTYI